MWGCGLSAADRCPEILDELVIIAEVAETAMPYLLGGWQGDNVNDRQEISPEAATMLTALGLAKKFPSIKSYLGWLFTEDAKGAIDLGNTGQLGALGRPGDL